VREKWVGLEEFSMT